MLVLLLMFAELGLRVLKVAGSCTSGQACDYHWVSQLQVRSLAEKAGRKVGFSAIHPVLGYVPAAGFDDVLDSHGWGGKRLTIGPEGFRDNGNGLAGPKRILTVGDSFTFGDQVSNHETWPACLERKTGIAVANAGVFGYGGAQSVLRAKLEVDQSTFDTVIVSVLVEGDFERDRMSYRSGLARPAVIRAGDSLDWAPPPDPRAQGTLWNPVTNEVPAATRFAQVLYEHSELLASLVDRFSEGHLGYGRLSSEHPDAASVDEIIRFALGELANLPVPQKVLVLQYSRHLEQGRGTERKRRLLTETAASLGIPVVDTLDVLKREDPDAIWDGHHTAYGNSVVCETVLSALR
ncbi:MAG: hypothetical protein FGM40_02225 [Rhodocyclaceae bacterium]|nr:hypothetical protein [Rhodocyclaceae bacterium]